jgi:hypothetical protein
MMMMMIDDDDDNNDDDNKPFWPTWAVGFLSGVRDVQTHTTADAFLRGISGVSQVPIIDNMRDQAVI